MWKKKSEVPGLSINVWYLDDGTLCSSAEDLRKALSIIEEQGPSRARALVEQKLIPAVRCKDDALDHNPIPSDIPIVREGFDLLGCPIGSPAFCADSVIERVKKVQKALDLFPALEDSQMAATLLRSCLTLSKLSFAPRTCPLNYIREAIASFNLSLFESLSDLVGGLLIIDLSEDSGVLSY